MAEGKDQNIPNVTARENHIACNGFTRSELVVLLRKNGEIVGQIDIDNDVVDPFLTCFEDSRKRPGRFVVRL